MMSEKLARRFVACGWIAALLSAFGTFCVGFTIAKKDPVVLIEAALLLLLAYGIYRNSRVCSVIALVFFLIERIGLYHVAVAVKQAHGGNILIGFWISVVIFTTLYALGVVGAVAWHMGRPSDNDPRQE